MAFPRPTGPAAPSKAASRRSSLRGLRGAQVLKRSNFRAIVLCNAFTELAQGAIAFPADRAACASRCAGGDSFQAPLVPGIPVLFRLCTLRTCQVLFALRAVFRPGRERERVFVCVLRYAVD